MVVESAPGLLPVTGSQCWFSPSDATLDRSPVSSSPVLLALYPVRSRAAGAGTDFS